MSTWGGARLIAAGILLSRISGLVRQKVIAWFLGDGDAAGTTVGPAALGAMAGGA